MACWRLAGGRFAGSAGWVLRGGQPRGRSRGVNRVDAHARSTWRRIEVPLPGALMISTRASIRLARWNMPGRPLPPVALVTRVGLGPGSPLLPVGLVLVVGQVLPESGLLVVSFVVPFVGPGRGLAGSGPDLREPPLPLVGLLMPGLAVAMPDSLVPGLAEPMPDVPGPGVLDAPLPDAPLPPVSEPPVLMVLMVPMVPLVPPVL